MESIDIFKDKYVDQFGFTLKQQIVQYMETKSMSHELTNYINEYGISNPIRLYRGDCLYESVIKKGNSFKLWNGFASFTYDNEIADKFANSDNAPDWYFEENEWCANAEYPFKEFIDKGESLVPVIIVIEENELSNCLCTDNYLDKYNESEYLVITESVEFIINRIEDKFLYCSVRKIPNMHLWK